MKTNQAAGLSDVIRWTSDGETQRLERQGGPVVADKHFIFIFHYLHKSDISGLSLLNLTCEFCTILLQTAPWKNTVSMLKARRRLLVLYFNPLFRSETVRLCMHACVYVCVTVAATNMFEAIYSKCGERRATAECCMLISQQLSVRYKSHFTLFSDSQERRLHGNGAVK